VQGVEEGEEGEGISKWWFEFGHSIVEVCQAILYFRTLPHAYITELDRKAKCIVQMQGSQTILNPVTTSDSKNKNSKAVAEYTKAFAFDRSYWSFNRNDSHYAGQDNLFEDLGKPLLDNAFQGYNNCIFAYGQTGSGKSYSMMGYGPEEGVIPKICRDLFERIDRIQQDSSLSCTVEVSYLEIYNERVRDLLNPTTKGNLRVREHPSTGPYVEDLATLVVRSFAEIENLMDEGNKARTVAATNMNETSSRSHAVFTLTLTQKRHDIETNMDSEKVAKISLVDLAGSERANSTGATGARLKEGAEINRSLSTLGRVIAALADLSTGKKKSGTIVPYRDSVLTWLLKDSLGGNSMTAMIAAISPADINFEETLSTLRYADSAKRIQNHAVVNEDPNARMIRELKEELAQLRSKLGGAPVDGGSAQEQYPPGTPLDQQFVSIVQADGSSKKVSKAEIADQLSQSEKLYQDLNQTWEQKLQKTEMVHKEREAALEELGISIEKGFVGLSTPKRMPHLVNLSDDPLLAGCLIYNLKPGTTTVGNVDTSQTADIRLTGSKILHDHCAFENVDGVVTIIPFTNAAVMINGVRTEQAKRLRTGYRVILGDFHIFRFNHPQEARAERDEGSRLKHFMTAEDVDSPSLRPNHIRHPSNISRPDSDIERDRSMATSPIPFPRTTRESDWNFARREAVSTIIDSESKMTEMTDDELNNLLEDLQRIRAARSGQAGSRLLTASPDDETDSVTSFRSREKYFSNGTLDAFSLDTALTMPSTPQNPQSPTKIVNMENELETQKHEFDVDSMNQVSGNVEIENAELEQIRAEKIVVEASLKAMREEMEYMKQMQKTRQNEVSLSSAIENVGGGLQHTKVDKDVVDHQARQKNLMHKYWSKWRRHTTVAMAITMLQNSKLLKEAQIMARALNRNVTFQFAVADAGHIHGSTYDLVLDNDTTDSDYAFIQRRKPCIVVRVMDFKHCVVQLWSIDKFHQKVRMMKQVYQYLDRPEYLQHFKTDNPFTEAFRPEYTRIGDADIPLAAVLECRMRDFVLDVYCPYTYMIVGLLRLSLEPSSAEAHPSMLKFNVVMHDLAGFAEREGSNVHAMLFFPDALDTDHGVTTTQMVSGFDEGPIKFESVHTLSVSMRNSPNICLRIAIFAKVRAMHLDKLLSWDNMQDRVRHNAEHQNHSANDCCQAIKYDRHDIFARTQIQEITQDETYRAVEVHKTDSLDSGTFQLRHGLQRRLVIDLTSTSGATVPWTDIGSVKIGCMQLVDADGKSTGEADIQENVVLTVLGEPIFRTNRDYTTSAKIVTQWDAGARALSALHRPTAEGMRVKMSILWHMKSIKLVVSLPLSLEIHVQMRPRSYVKPQSLLSQLWSSEKLPRSVTGVYAMYVRPCASRRIEHTHPREEYDDHVAFEETLGDWSPRGLSLIRGYITMRNKRQRAAELAAIPHTYRNNNSLGIEAPSGSISHDNHSFAGEALLHRCLGLWQRYPDSSLSLLTGVDGECTHKSSNKSIEVSRPDTLLATAKSIVKNGLLLKAGPVYMTSVDSTRWERRFVELRPPYLHIYSSTTGDELSAINMTDLRIDTAPSLSESLLKEKRPGMSEWALCSKYRTWIFAARGDREKGEWIWNIDRCWADEAYIDQVQSNNSGSQ